MSNIMLIVNAYTIMLDIMCEDRNMCTWFLLNMCVYIRARSYIHSEVSVQRLRAGKI